jgi:hypothetical protein
VLDVFAAAGLTPKIILRAIDAAVVEAGVERGLGPAINRPLPNLPPNLVFR